MLQQPESPKPGPATGSGLRGLGLECGGRCRWPEHTPNTPNLKTNPIVPNVIDRPATDHCTPARASTLHCSGGQCDSWASQQELNISLLCFHSLSLLVFRSLPSRGSCPSPEYCSGPIPLLCCISGCSRMFPYPFPNHVKVLCS
jgi:hypothetical protein